jgi:hypothetical protein
VCDVMPELEEKAAGQMARCWHPYVAAGVAA